MNVWSRDVSQLSRCVFPQVRGVCGATYMLTQDEELWEKELPPAVEELLSAAKDPMADRSDRCETYTHAPHTALFAYTHSC